MLHDYLILAKNIRETTARHLAVENSELDVFYKLWGWAKEVLTPKDLNNKLFLAKDNGARNACHVAV